MEAGTLAKIPPLPHPRLRREFCPEFREPNLVRPNRDRPGGLTESGQDRERP